jgi:hypothetical protein
LEDVGSEGSRLTCSFSVEGGVKREVMLNQQAFLVGDGSILKKYIPSTPIQNKGIQYFILQNIKDIFWQQGNHTNTNPQESNLLRN